MISLAGDGLTGQTNPDLAPRALITLWAECADPCFHVCSLLSLWTTLSDPSPRTSLAQQTLPGANYSTRGGSVVLSGCSLDPWTDRGHVGEIISFNWPGNALGFPRRSRWKLLLLHRYLFGKLNEIPKLRPAPVVCSEWEQRSSTANRNLLM